MNLYSHEPILTRKHYDISYEFVVSFRLLDPSKIWKHKSSINLTKFPNHK